MSLETLLDFTIAFSTHRGEDRWLPTASESSEGYDVRCCLPDGDGDPPGTITLQPGDEVTVGTGLCVTQTFPKHVAMLVLPRSSTGKRSITLRNSPGLVDRAYVGREIRLMLRNDGREPQTIEHGERLAQLLFVLCAHPAVLRTDPLPDGDRGREGFGSTGKF
ncbi:MAG TPA: hypothetical protein VG818_02665 [Gemmatimonadaceae bacterium]|jgi:dUTP pyrophosphatase|nr:hypothetical protein [Gemmatimonadaceae bacterium]